MGEVLASYPFTKLLLETFPKSSVLYTVVTETGIARVRELFNGKVSVIRFPFDSYRHLTRIHRVFRPDAVFIIETEIWPNLLLSAYERNVPLFLLNARISRNTVSRFRLIKRLSRFLLNTFTVIFARSAHDAKMFVEAGADPSRIIVTGSLKYDTISRPLKGITRQELGFSENDFIITFGSVRSREFADVVEAIKIIVDSVDAGIVVAPRHLKNVPVLKNMLVSEGLKVALRSRKEPADGKILLLDTIGELWDVYHLSNLAFVGGSLADYGGHNVLEPAYAGIPVIFGPHIWNIRDYAYPMMEAGVAFRVFDGKELGQLAVSFARDPEKAARIGRKAREFVKQRAGVSKRILERVRRYIRV